MNGYYSAGLNDFGPSAILLALILPNGERMCIADLLQATPFPEELELLS